MASIAKKDEILYVLGQEDEPCILERHRQSSISSSKSATQLIASPLHFTASAEAPSKPKPLFSKSPASAHAPPQKLLQRYGSIANCSARPSLEELNRMVTQKAPRKSWNILQMPPRTANC